MEQRSDTMPVAQEALPGEAPDWVRIEHEVLCPLCEYNLRGLSQPRCPECGYRFTWPEVVDPTRRLHPYLYEHHPERGLRAFVSTALHGLLPKRFWRSLNPAQPSRPERLRRYWFLCAALLILGTCCMSLPVGFIVYNRVAQRNAAIVAQLTANFNAQLAARQKHYAQMDLPQSDLNADAQFYQQQIQHFARRYARPPLSMIAETAGGVVVVLLVFSTGPLLWPWATFLTLMIFGWSMRRARIQPIHVLRCCLYSFDGLWWAGLLLIPAGLLDAFNPMSGSGPAIYGNWLLPVLMLTIVVGAWKLWRAYQCYLRFDRPFWTAVASQFILILLAIIIWVRLDPTGFGIMVIE